MKLKTDLCMWLKSIKENKSSYFYWGYLLIIGIIFYIMNCYTPLYSDDWHYCFIFGTTEPIDSISDIIKSQYIHYFQQNGRFIPHFFVQLFDGILGKEWFNVANTIVFILFLYLSTLTCTSNKKEYYLVTSLIIVLIFFFIPGFKECFLWMSGACNYLWTATLLLTFNRLLQININNHKLIPFLFLFGIICGWTHEGLVIGLGVGYLIYFYYYKKNIDIIKLFLLIGFYVGAIFLILSPGSIHRAIGNENVISSVLNNIMSYIFSLYYMHYIRLLPILIITIIIYYFFFNQRSFIKNFFHENIVLFTAIIILFFFVIFTRHSSAYSRFGFELFSLILVVKVISKTSYIKSYHIILLNICMILFFIISIIPACYKNFQEYKHIIEQIKTSNNSIIYTNNPPNNTNNRFILPYISPDADLFCKTTWENTLIAKYFMKKEIIFLPEELNKDLKKTPNKFASLYTSSNYPFYIKRLEDEELDKKINKVIYKLNKTNFSSLPIYIRPFAHYLGRYSYTEVEANHSVIKIKENFYLVIGKNKLIEDRIIDITY